MTAPTTPLDRPRQPLPAWAQPCFTSRPFDTSGRVNSLFLLQFRPAALDVFHPTEVKERLLGNVIDLAVADHPERFDGLADRHGRAGDVGELGGHVRVLAEELLDSPGAVDDDLVFFTQLVDAEDGDDVLELLVALQDLLHAHGDVVVLLTDVLRIEDA